MALGGIKDPRYQCGPWWKQGPWTSNPKCSWTTDPVMFLAASLARYLHGPSWQCRFLKMAWTQSLYGPQKATWPQVAPQILGITWPSMATGASDINGHQMQTLTAVGPWTQTQTSLWPLVTSRLPTSFCLFLTSLDSSDLPLCTADINLSAPLSFSFPLLLPLP